jgi:hypothetical protein
MQVALKQIVGHYLGDPSGSPVPQPIDFVMFAGRSVATCAHHENSPVCFIAPLPEEQRKAVVKEVARLRAEDNKRTSVKDVAMPVIPPGVDDEATDLEEDDE